MANEPEKPTPPQPEKTDQPQPAKAAEQEYFFPAHGKTVRATSREEAEKKVASLAAASDNT